MGMKNMSYDKHVKDIKSLDVILITIISLVILLGIFAIMVSKTKNEVTYQEEVCNNLEKEVNGEIEIFPEIQITMQQIAKIYAFTVVVEGRSSTPWKWDEDGVMCSMDIQLCEISNLFCMNATMQVPVEYNEWEFFQMKKPPAESQYVPIDQLKTNNTICEESNETICNLDLK